MMLAYSPALSGQFLWDDSTWITDWSSRRLLRDEHGLWRMWTEIGALQQYFPLTGTSFWLDHHFWGEWTLPYHVENVLLHAGTALLFGQMLTKLKVQGAWLAAGLFALHPVMVESVAWITERKNVLSGFFFMASLLAYGRATSWWKKRDAVLSYGPYALALLWFVLALLSKSTVVILPALLLLLAWWRNGTVRWRSDVLPTLPFFALGLVAGLLSVWLERHRIGATGSPWDLTLSERFLVAGRVPWFYLGKIVWPADITAIYPRWDMAGATWLVWLYPVATVGVMVFLWCLRKRWGRGPLVAGTFYLLGLFPVMGFFNVYGMLHSFVTDRWSYLPSLAIFTVAASGIHHAARAQKTFLYPATSALVLAALTWLTWNGAARFRDEKTLWQATVATNPSAWPAWYNLAQEDARAGEPAQAMLCYQRALELAPENADVLTDMGSFLRTQGEERKGRELLEKAVAVRPGYAIARNNLGVALMDSLEFTAAIEQLQRASELDPSDFQVWSNLGNAYLRDRRPKEAIRCYQRAIEVNPEAAFIRGNYGAALALEERWNEALTQLRTALELEPNNENAATNLRYVLRKLGREAEVDASRSAHQR